MYVVRGHLFHRAPRERYQVKAKRRVSNSQVCVWGGGGSRSLILAVGEVPKQFNPSELSISKLSIQTNETK